MRNRVYILATWRRYASLTLEFHAIGTKCAGFETYGNRQNRHHASRRTDRERPRKPGRTRIPRRTFEHRGRAAPKGFGGGWIDPGLSGRLGPEALRPLNHSPGPDHAGEPKRGGAEGVRRGNRGVPLGGAVFPDVGKRRLPRHR